MRPAAQGAMPDIHEERPTGMHAESATEEGKLQNAQRRRGQRPTRAKAPDESYALRWEMIWS